ncbi:hypothetical protein [Listeria monocytogenes]|nr:hypothetical protein [Listeria monocytogenes]
MASFVPALMACFFVVFEMDLIALLALVMTFFVAFLSHFKMCLY